MLDRYKAMAVYDGCMTSSLALLADGSDGGRFGVSNIVGVSLITCEDSDSGSYIKDNSCLKSIISHDAIQVESKNKGAFDYTPHALTRRSSLESPSLRVLTASGRRTRTRVATCSRRVARSGARPCKLTGDLSLDESEGRHSHLTRSNPVMLV